MKKIWFISLLLLISAHINCALSRDSVFVLKVQEAIGPATSDYIARGIEEAYKQHAKAVIIELDTPGGLDTSMREIIKAIFDSPIPIITYVAPSGARAASAGTYILYASHIAAMAPGTNVGAATPVNMGGGFDPGNEMDKKKKQPTTDSMQKKAIEDAVAYLKSLAQLRYRNVKWAENAVREASSISAQEALKQNVIDIVATNKEVLLRNIQGRSLNILGKEVIISFKNPQIKYIEPDWRSKFLSTITDPSVAYILLMIGMYGLFFEFASPGMIVPGIVGSVSLLVAVYALQLLPINYAGLGLLILGMIFMVSEAFVTSYGALGIGGIIAFILGSIFLFESDFILFQITYPLIITMLILNIFLVGFLVSSVIKSRRRQVVSGREDLMNREGVILYDMKGTEGFARIKGETWKIRCEQSLVKNQKINVVGINGLILEVKPKINKGE